MCTFFAESSIILAFSGESKIITSEEGSDMEVCVIIEKLPAGGLQCAVTVGLQIIPSSGMYILFTVIHK